MGSRKKQCALCGEFALTTADHIPPKGLYPPSRRSKTRRITIPTCTACNNGSASDDVHFRNVVLMAGKSNDAVQEVWEGPMRRSLAQVDGRRRASDVYSIMKPAPDVSADRFRIFPADDPRVLKTVRKIVRGLCHHHGIQSAVKDDQVIADTLRHEIPEGLLSGMTHHHVEQDVFEYQFAISERPYAASLWLLRFYERTTFVATAFNSLADKAAFNADTESLWPGVHIA